MSLPQDALRVQTFTVEWGLQRLQPRRRRKLPHRTWLQVRIALPPNKQMAICQPELVKRLVSDWGDRLSSLDCSTGDFRKALEEGSVSIAHVFAEAFCLWLDAVSLGLEHGHIRFAEQFNTRQNRANSLSTIRLASSHPFPPKLVGGLEYKVAEYLNKLMEGEDYDLDTRIAEYIAFRARRSRKRTHKAISGRR